MSFDFKKAFISAISQTDDLLAAIKLQEAYAGAEKVGKMFATKGANQDATQDYTANLLKNFPDDMDAIARDPSFICALCVLLAGALEEYGKSLG